MVETNKEVVEVNGINLYGYWSTVAIMAVGNYVVFQNYPAALIVNSGWLIASVAGRFCWTFKFRGTMEE